MFCRQRRRCCYTPFSFGIQKTSVICHNVNTHKVKITRRDRPHILASNRCETFENLLHIDIAPLRSTLSGILHSKNWTMIFIGIKGPWLCQCKIHSFVAPDQDTARYVQHRKMCKFNRNLYNTQLIQFAPIPAEFVVRFIRYQYLVKVIFYSCLVSTFKISVQSKSTIFSVVHSMHFFAPAGISPRRRDPEEAL